MLPPSLTVKTQGVSVADRESAHTHGQYVALGSSSSTSPRVLGHRWRTDASGSSPPGRWSYAITAGGWVPAAREEGWRLEPRLLNEPKCRWERCPRCRGAADGLVIAPFSQTQRCAWSDVTGEQHNAAQRGRSKWDRTSQRSEDGEIFPARPRLPLRLSSHSR